MEFFVVYIMEAHPLDGWVEDDNVKEKISLSSPKSFSERCAVAQDCVTKLSLRIPPLVDDLANSTEIAYTGWPDRLYVIDRDGRVAYKSKAGPYGFMPAEVESVLKRIAPGPAAPAIHAGF